jgi:magnesium-transporting ATPase (P-type)
VSAPALADASTDMPIECLPVAAVYAAAGTRPDGLTAGEAVARARTHGPNVLQVARRRPLVLRLSSHFTHLMALLLWAGAAAALVAGLVQLSVAFVLVNLVNGLFSFWQEYKAERATEALRRLLPIQARVLRAGREVRLPADELVPGDVLLLDEGDRISADGRVVEHAELRVDQSTLTGETTPVRRSAEAAPAATGNRADTPNLVFAGTNVASGRGKAVVVAIGMGTEFGRIAGLTQSLGGEPSPLQRELARLSTVVSILAVAIGSSLAAVALAMGAMDVGDGLIFGLGIIVAFVPEGLLPTVTLSLAMATQRMAGRNALVKRLSAVETLGSTSVICTDKTGTLTQNEMTVREAYLPAGTVTFEGVGYAPAGRVLGAAPGTPLAGDVEAMLTAAGLACNARLVEVEGQWTVLGDPTEAAVEVASRKDGVDLEAAARCTPRLAELPFDPRRRRMSTLHRAGDRCVLHTKGAPRELLALCTGYREGGAVVPLDPEARLRIEAANDDLSRRGLRVLAVATRDLPAEVRDRTPEVLERDLTFLGLVAMLDPPRPEVEAAVRTCRSAGIRTVMITGDYGLTAVSIARRTGLVGTGAVRVVNGDELDGLDDDELDATLRSEVLFARSSPEHKLRVVSAFQRLGHVVAVTGDGVNDAPALKQADIGVAMGRSGTDVAREAADMILLDDNFASIVNAVEEGRAVFANIRRFTSYVFTSNAPEAVPFMAFALSGGRIPLALPIMAVLAIDLGTDLVPALALGAEPPEPGVMERPPRQRSQHIVTRELLARAYLLLGGVQSLAVMALFFGTYWVNGYAGQWLDLPDGGSLYEQAVAMAFATVVFTQIGNLFAQRVEHTSIVHARLAPNRLVWIGIATELVLLALIVYVPVLQGIVGTGPLPAAAWLVLMPCIPLLLVTDELRKLVERRRTGAREVTGP